MRISRAHAWPKTQIAIPSLPFSHSRGMHPTSFSSKFVSIGQRSIHIRFSDPPPNGATKPPVIFLHAVGSNSSSWVTPFLMALQLTKHRQLVLFDSDGHGLTPG